MKLVCVSNGPLPYHTPILNELSKLTDLHVLYMFGGHPQGSFSDLWGAEPTFSHEMYWSLALRRSSNDFRVQLSLGVSRRLQKLNPDVIFFSSWGPLVIEPLLWKRVANRKAVMWAESTSFSGLLRNGAANFARRLVLSQVDTFVTNGSRATAYLETLGVNTNTIVTSCLPSVAWSGTPALLDDAEPSPAGRAGPNYLFVGRMIALKRPLELMQAFACVRDELPEATLTMVGAGPLLSEISRAALPFGSRASLPGRLEGEALHQIYAQADVLVLPSVRDVWGLVVNEALSHGLYVITTDKVGSAHDLLDDENGVIVPADDPRAFAAAMVKAGRTVSRDAGARAARARSIAHRTPAAFARDIYRAAALALGAER